MCDTAPSPPSVGRQLLDTEEEKAALEAYMWGEGIIDQASSIVRIAKFSHGQSNPTFFIKVSGPHNQCSLVLRKKPPPPILPSAHAIEREYRVLKALDLVGFPVPKPIALCENPHVLGTPFYLMEFVSGRIHESPSLEDVQSPIVRQRIYLETARCLARLHCIDPFSVGLGDFGRMGGQDANLRQVETWYKQFVRSDSSQFLRGKMQRLYELLKEYAPGCGGTDVAITHGDFRLDNIIFDGENAQILGLLDWELSTLGDPIADLAYSCLPYYIPRHCLPRMALPHPLPGGIPSMDEYVAEYCIKRRISRPSPKDWKFYVSLGLFRLSSILAGVAARAKAGNASSDRASELASDDNVSSLMQVALDLMSESGSPEIPEKQDVVERVRSFVRENVLPAEDTLNNHARSSQRWNIHPLHEELKQKAKKAGLWNLWISPELAGMLKLPHSECHAGRDAGLLGAGLSNAEYARAAEIMGYSPWASEVFNCSAPDTGNMEVLLRYGSIDQQRQYLLPLLRGEIRSCFAMTEQRVASSDATNIESSIKFDSDSQMYVLNGHKWWTSGACDPRCKFAIFMGKTRFDGPVHNQQSMILVPMPHKGIKNVMPLSVFGYDDAPHGHAEMTFEDVRVPKENLILGPGRGFEIAQGRLGPGRIHHCMRLVGMGQRALDLLLERIHDRSTFGKLFADHQSIREDVARCRIELNTARLVVLDAANSIDSVGAKAARSKISIAKVYTPNAILALIDRVIQIFGGAGVSDKFPLAAMYSACRTLRIADGPDNVHLSTIAKEEIRRGRSRVAASKL
jgi:acyl-CoA dehydrogenase